VLVEDAKDGVGANKIMRPKCPTAGAPLLSWQIVRVDCHGAIQTGQAGINAAIDRMQVLVGVLGEIDLAAGPFSAWGGRIAGGGKQRAVIAVVIKNTGRFGCAAGELGQKAGKRVGRLCG
jgi:hypothetical protein